MRECVVVFLCMLILCIVCPGRFEYRKQNCVRDDDFEFEEVLKEGGGGVSVQPAQEFDFWELCGESCVVWKNEPE